MKSIRGVAWLMAASLLSSTPTLAQKAPPKGRTRQIFVRVVDRAGSPVLDLQPGDFDVKEGGVNRAVARARLATSPMRVAVLVDTSDAASASLNPIRAALQQFFDALPPEHEAMLISTGRQLRVRAQPTLERKKLKDAAAALFPDGGGATLTDSLLETDDRFMRKTEDRWPVFVILTTDATETSAGARENEFNRWLQSIGARGITAHAILLKGGRGNGLTEILAMNVTENSGGRYAALNTPTALPEKMKALAVALGEDHKAARTRYQIEFATDAAGDPAVDVGVARENVSLTITLTRLR